MQGLFGQSCPELYERFRLGNCPKEIVLSFRRQVACCAAATFFFDPVHAPPPRVMGCTSKIVNATHGRLTAGSSRSALEQGNISTGQCAALKKYNPHAICLTYRQTAVAWDNEPPFSQAVRRAAIACRGIPPSAGSAYNGRVQRLTIN